MRCVWDSLQKFLQRWSSARTLQATAPILQQIHSQREPLQSLTDNRLRENALSLRERAAAPDSLDELVPECFALVAEAAKRTLEIEPFDVQLMAALVLHRGRIAEMQTGEGKTLAAVFRRVVLATRVGHAAST